MTLGVQVHARSSAHLLRLYILGICAGFRVRMLASATLCDCTVEDTVDSRGWFAEVATGRLDRCTLSRSKHPDGLTVEDAGSRVHAENCHFLGSTGCGAVAIERGSLTQMPARAPDTRAQDTTCTERAVRWSSPTAVAMVNFVAVRQLMAAS